MPTTNSTVAGSLLLTTVLANYQVLPVTHTLVPAEFTVGADLYRMAQRATEAEQPSWLSSRVENEEDIREERGADADEDPGLVSKTQRGADEDGDLRGSASSNTTEKADVSDTGAVMYIIVVLVFYSTGVMVMIVRYLRTEKKELEEEVTLENFFNSMPDKRAEKENHVNRMAIRAFHTLTSISYDDDELEGLDLGSDVETESSREQKSLDASSSQPLLMTDL